MSRIVTAIIKCDRCRKVYHQGPEAELNQIPSHGLTLTFGEQKVEFPDLCEGCQGALNNLIARIKNEDPPAEGPRTRRRGTPDPDPAKPAELPPLLDPSIRAETAANPNPPANPPANPPDPDQPF